MQALPYSWAPQSCGRVQTSPFAGRVRNVRACSDGRSCLQHESRSLRHTCQGVSAADAWPCIVRAHCMRLDPSASAWSQIDPAMQFSDAGFRQRIQRASAPTGDRRLLIRRPHCGTGHSCAQLGAGRLPAELSLSPWRVEVHADLRVPHYHQHCAGAGGAVFTEACPGLCGRGFPAAASGPAETACVSP